MINSTKSVLKFDFDAFVGGHVDMGTKADVVRYLSYLELLYDQVITGILAKKSLDDIKQDIDLSQFSDLKQIYPLHSYKTDKI